MKATKEQINHFFAPKKIAVAGVSIDNKKFGYQVFNHLIQNGYEVIPINPNHDKIDETNCFKSVEELPDSVESLLILTNKNQTNDVLKKALNKSIPNIWVQQSCETKESLQIAEEHSKKVIFKECIFMFTEPVKGFHQFHKTIVKLFGKHPK